MVDGRKYSPDFSYLDCHLPICKKDGLRCVYNYGKCKEFGCQKKTGHYTTTLSSQPAQTLTMEALEKGLAALAKVTDSLCALKLSTRVYDCLTDPSVIVDSIIDPKWNKLYGVRIDKWPALPEAIAIEEYTSGRVCLYNIFLKQRQEIAKDLMKIYQPAKPHTEAQTGPDT